MGCPILFVLSEVEGSAFLILHKGWESTSPNQPPARWPHAFIVSSRCRRQARTGSSQKQSARRREPSWARCPFPTRRQSAPGHESSHRQRSKCAESRPCWLRAPKHLCHKKVSEPI